MSTKKLILTLEVVFSSDADEQEVLAEVEIALSQLKEQGVDIIIDKVEPV